MKHKQTTWQWRHAAIGLALALYGVGAASAGVIPVTERAVLTTIYNGTNGPSWLNSSNWRNTPPADDPFEVDECVWHGITCDNDSIFNPTPHIIAINLSNNYLAGTLPALDGLPYLVNIDVSGNNGVIESAGPLTGPIPPLAVLIHLQTFRGSFNQFTGSIPSLSGLIDLREFDVHDNHLSGPLPALSGLVNLETFSASNLAYSSASGNHLTGSIPALTGLLHLLTFTVDGNQLSGSIPSLTGLASLQGIAVSNNSLSGTIPSLAGLTALGGFLASNNQLSGAIPSLADLVNLGTFDVSGNQLSGSVPAIAGHALLSSFHVENNQLTGSLPAFTNIPFLTGFYADHNQLIGPLPALDSAYDLGELDVSYNSLSGTLPTLYVTGLNQMVAIHLDHNQFSGALPAPPKYLANGLSTICPNLFTLTDAPAWNVATGVTPWWATPSSTNHCDGVLTPTKLAVTGVNGGANPTVGVGFNVIVQAQDGASTAQNVATSTAVTLSLNTGTGTLGGTLTCTITAGSNSCTVIGMTYSKGEAGVSFTATRTSGDTLTAGNSAAFTVVIAAPGAPTLLRVVAGRSSMKIFFSPPESDGGSSITGYTATCAGGGNNYAQPGGSSPITVSGLTPGVSYTCSIHASNGAGSGGESAAATKVAQPPGLAGLLSIILGN